MYPLPLRSNLLDLSKRNESSRKEMYSETVFSSISVPRPLDSVTISDERNLELLPVMYRSTFLLPASPLTRSTKSSANWISSIIT